MNYTCYHTVPAYKPFPARFSFRGILSSIFFVLLVGFSAGVNGQTITLNSVSPTPPVCAGTILNLNFSTSGTPGNNTYTASLSQSNGSFAPALATVTSGNINGNQTNNTSLSLTVPLTAATSSTYFIHITSGATTSNSIILTINAQPTITGTLTTCVGGTTTLTGSGIPAAANAWSSATTTVATIDPITGVVTGKAAGTSLITYTDNKGCTNTATVTVNTYPTLTSTQTPTSICSNTLFSYTPASSIGGTTYSWTRAAVAGISNAAGSGTGSISETLINTTASAINVTYVYTLTANGCTNPTTYNVTVQVKPLPTASINQSGTYCKTSSNLQLTVTGQTGGTFSSSSPNLVVSSAGVINFSASTIGGPYTVTYTFTDGTCSNTTTTSITVTAGSGTTNINGTTALCMGQTSLLTSSPAGGIWTSSNTSVATIDNIVTPGMVSTVGVGSTTITYLISTGGCTSTGTTTVTVTALPTVSITGSSTICSGTTTTLSPTSGGTWVSNNTSVATVNGSTGVVTGTGAGNTTFTFTSSTAPNCQATTGTVSVTAAPAITTQPFSLADCKGNSVTFTAAYTAAGNVTYQWQTSPDGITWTNIGAFPNVTNASGSSSSSPLQLTIANIGVGGGNGANTNGTRYRVIITDANTCSVTTNGVATLTVNSISAISGNVTTTLCEGQSISYTVTTSGNAPVSYQWVKHVGAGVWNDVAGATSATLSFASVTLADAGEYAIKVTFPSTTNSGAPSTCIETNNYGITRTIIVNPAATVTAGGPDNICQSSSPSTFALAGASIGGGATTGAWSITGGTGTLSTPAQTSTPATVTFTPTAGFTGTVTLTLTTNDPDGAGGPCVAVNATRTINVLPSPAKPTLGKNSPCIGGTLNLTASLIAGVTYSWTGPNSFTSSQQNPTINNVPYAASGKYILTVTSANGCTNSDSINVTICTTLSSNTITLATRNCIVALEGATVTGCTNVTYQWWTSVDNNSPASYSAIPGATGVNYTVPSGEKNNWFYRVAICSDDNSTSQSNTLHAHPPMSLTLSQTNVSCFGGNNGTASVTVADGSPQYTWQWKNSLGTVLLSGTSNSGSGFTASIPNLTAGTYTFTVTDSDNPQPCSRDTTVTITQPSQLSVSIPAATYCSGSSNTLTATPSGGTPSYTYQWQNNGVNIPGAFNNTYNASSAGTYSVVVTDANNCQANSSGTIIINPAPTVNANVDQSVCAGSPNVTLNGSIGGGATSATWSGGTGTFTPNASALNAVYTPSAAEITAGTVTLTLTTDDPAGPCTAVSDQMTITISPAATVNAGGPDVVCQSATPSAITLSGATFGGAASTAAWSIISGGGSLSSTAQTATPATVTYTPAANFTGTVTIRLTTNDPDGVGPCVAATQDRTITVNPVATVSAGANSTICQSATPAAITLTGATIGGAATTGTWSITAGGGTLSNTGATATPATVTYTPAANFNGTVTLTLTTNDPDGAGPCVPVSATRTITVNQSPTVNAGGPDVVCQSATPSAITLSGATIGGAATTAAWSIISGGGTLSSTAQTPTPATVTYTPAANFTGTVTIRLTTNDPDGVGPCVAATQDRTITVNPVATVSAGANSTICQSATPAAITLSGATIGGAATTGTWSITAGGGTLSNTSATATPATVTYTPAANFNGTVTLTLTTDDPDGAGPCVPVSATRTITISPAATVNAGGPDVVCQSATPSAITLSGAGFGGAATTAAWSIISGGGTLSSIAQTATPATVTYTPAANFTGTVTIRLTTNDPDGVGPCVAATQDRTITVNPVATVSAGANSTICQSATPAAITLTGATIGGAATTGTWSITAGGGTLSNTSATATPATVTYTPAANFNGTVTLTLTTDDPDGAGPCVPVSATRTITITQASTVTVGSVSPVCQSSSPSAITLSGASFGGGATTAAWSIISGGGTLSSTAQTAAPATVTYTPAANFTGTITLRLTTNATAGCTAATADVTITVNATPGAPAAIDGANCGTGTVTLDATGCTGTLQWYNLASAGSLLGTGSPFVTPSISATTTFYVTCLSAAGCESNPRTAVFATIKPLDPGSIAAGQTICSGGDPAAFTSVAASSTDNNVNSNITYQWYSGSSATGPWTPIGGATAATYDVPAGLAATTYYYREATGKKTNGPPAGQYTCIVNSNVISVNVNPLPSITGTQTVCVGSTTQLTGSGTASSWTSSNNSIATVSAAGLVTGVAAGTATITYTDSNGCKKTTTITVNPKPTPVITHN